MFDLKTKKGIVEYLEECVKEYEKKNMLVDVLLLKKVIDAIKLNLVDKN